MLARALGLAVLLLGGLARGVLAGPPGTGPLERFREAQALLAAGDPGGARVAFEDVPASHVLGDYAAFQAAEALQRGGELGAALERFRGFPDRFPDSLLVARAHLAAHDLAFQLGRFAEAEREGRRFRERAPSHPEAGRVQIRVAEARVAQGQVAEAITDLRRRYLEAPAGRWGEAARDLGDTLARQYGLPLAPLSLEEQLTLAQRLADGGEPTAAVRVLEGVLAGRPEPALRHRTLVRMAPLLGRLGRGPDGIGRLQTAVDEPATPARAGLLYELGRLLLRAGQPAAAVPVLERLRAEHRDASVVPDGWLQLARARLELRHGEAARATFQALIGAHPDSAAAVVARWELAWIEYRAGRPRDAALAFRQLAGAVPSARQGGLYWAARSLEQGGEGPAAATLYRDVETRGPNGYYGVLAARRGSGPLPVPGVPPVRLLEDPLAPLRPELRYQKAQALAAVGLPREAGDELDVLAREAAAESERAWGLSIAFADLGDAGRSLRQLRRGFGSAAEAGNPGLPSRFWHLYYPLGFREHVQDAARASGLDPFFVAAVIREESSYDPRARSGVGAVGLMQLMPETARLVAHQLGLSLAEPGALWEPPINIALGTRYLAQLRARFQEPLLAVAGYNAGPHRVDRWLAQRRGVDLEEFVEQIPFDETRAFAKRVFTSWHHYRRLYGGGASVEAGMAGAGARPVR